MFESLICVVLVCYGIAIYFLNKNLHFFINSYIENSTNINVFNQVISSLEERIEKLEEKGE